MVKNLLVIGKVWPEPDSSAAGLRMMQLLQLFVKQDYRITFASTAQKSEFSADLDSLGIVSCTIELNNTSFDDFAKKLDPDLVLFDRFTSEEQFGWRIQEQCPQAILLLDTEDLHFLRAARQIAFKQGRELELNDLHSAETYRELASIYRCDLSLIISRFELDFLKDKMLVPPRLLTYLPLFCEAIDPAREKQWPGFEQRLDFISIGNFLHEPNLDAVQYLRQHIWPIIHQRLPKARMLVYGAYPSHHVNSLNQKETNFFIKGRAANVDEVMQKARVCLAPLRFGAGIKGKLLDAMRNGTPSVTTPVGSEGMMGEGEWSGLIASDAETFANAAIELYENMDLWQKSQQRGAEIINLLFRPHPHSENFLHVLNNLRERIKEQREMNFTGRMLQHHALRSTKYMALWIEEKNKNNN